MKLFEAGSRKGRKKEYNVNTFTSIDPKTPRRRPSV